MLDNQGYRDKSEVSAAERERHEAYRKELLAMPPINSMERANKLRTFLVRHFECAEKHFQELKLPY